MFLSVVVNALGYTKQFSGMPFTQKERNVSNKQNGLKYPTQWEADQLTIYKHDRGAELGSTRKQLQLSAQSDT